MAEKKLPEFVLYARVGSADASPLSHKRYTAHVSADNADAAVENLRNSLTVAETREVQELRIIELGKMRVTAIKPA